MANGDDDDTYHARPRNYAQRIENDFSIAVSVAGLLFFLAGFLGAGGIFALKVLNWLRTAEMPQWQLSEFVSRPTQTDWDGVNVSLEWLWSQEIDLLVLAVGVVAGLVCLGLAKSSDRGSRF